VKKGRIYERHYLQSRGEISRIEEEVSRKHSHEKSRRKTPREIVDGALFGHREDIVNRVSGVTWTYSGRELIRRRKHKGRLFVREKR